MLTPAQSRAARGLLDWSQTELGKRSNLSESTVRDFEKGRRSPSINNLAAIQRALESAGIEFTNGSQPGVRMKGANSKMTQEQFATRVSLYEHNRLRSMGVHIPGEALPKFGFALVYHDRGRADLMLDGKELGRVYLHSGEIVFDPPLSAGRRQNALFDDFDEWASLAFSRSITSG